MAIRRAVLARAVVERDFQPQDDAYEAAGIHYATLGAAAASPLAAGAQQRERFRRI